MQLGSFRELFVFLLSDIYAVENKIVTDLPVMIKKADSEDLKEALQKHLEETKVQVKRLEKIFKIMDEKPHNVEWSQGVKTLFADAGRFFKENHSSPLVDAAIIVIAQRIEHYEIATYGSLKEFADVCDNDEVKALLKDTLKEECHADEALSKIAKGGLFTSGINIAATRNI